MAGDFPKVARGRFGVDSWRSRRLPEAYEALSRWPLEEQSRIDVRLCGVMCSHGWPRPRFRNLSLNELRFPGATARHPRPDACSECFPASNWLGGQAHRRFSCSMASTIGYLTDAGERYYQRCVKTRQARLVSTAQPAPGTSGETALQHHPRGYGLHSWCGPANLARLRRRCGPDDSTHHRLRMPRPDWRASTSLDPPGMGSATILNATGVCGCGHYSLAALADRADHSGVWARRKISVWPTGGLPPPVDTRPQWRPPDRANPIALADNAAFSRALPLGDCRYRPSCCPDAAGSCAMAALRRTAMLADRVSSSGHAVVRHK